MMWHWCLNLVNKVLFHSLLCSLWSEFRGSYSIRPVLWPSSSSVPLFESDWTRDLQAKRPISGRACPSTLLSPDPFLEQDVQDPHRQRQSLFHHIQSRGNPRQSSWWRCVRSESHSLSAPDPYGASPIVKCKERHSSKIDNVSNRSGAFCKVYSLYFYPIHCISQHQRCPLERCQIFS